MTYQALDTGGPAEAPVLFTFHGTGGNEVQFHELGQNLMPGARVVSPRGDVSEHGALRFFHRTGEGVYDMDDLARRRDAMAGFMATRADGANGVAGLGYSNGANILAAVLLHSPDMVDRAVLLHPLIPWQPEPQPGLAGRRILITAGRRDPICPAPETERLASYLDAQGAEVMLHWHPGGHEITRDEIDAAAAFLA